MLNQEIMTALVVIVLLIAGFAVFTLSPDTGKSLTGWASATQTISFLKSGTELFFEVKVDGVKDLTLTFKEDIKNAVLTITEVDAVSWNFQGTVYSRFKVSSVDADKVSGAKFTLKIKQDDLKRLGIPLPELKLYFEGQEVPTTLLNKEGDFAYYTAEASGIGEFVLGRAEKAKKAVAVVSTESTVVSAPVAEKAATETAPAEMVKSIPQQKELPLAGKATAAEEEKGFFGEVGDFFRGLFE